MKSYVLGLAEINHASLTLVGGKAASLGELARIEGIRVPQAFCVTTEAYQRITDQAALKALLTNLSHLGLPDRHQISEVCSEIRSLIETTVIPDDLQQAIAQALNASGAQQAYVVRSSATAEDLPHASFAGQQDSYLNLCGSEAILKHISKCWASLFTDRAVIYRLQNGFDHSKVQMAVLVQHMVFPQASGIMFTADPVSSNRKIISIEASFGLGEALVSGLVNPDHYQVREGQLLEQKIASKKTAVYALASGGTQAQEIEPERQNTQVLTPTQILQLARTGRQIEAHFGQPQDIEWCLAEETLFIVQSRPITTLFPIPAVDDSENHVYVSVGHQQMMTDPIRPLGLSFFLLTTRAPMRTAGGRLFVDISQMLATPAGRKTVIENLGKSDPLIKDALLNLVKRGDFVPVFETIEAEPGPDEQIPPFTAFSNPFPNDPAIVADLIMQSQTGIAALKQNIRNKSGLELFEFILEDIQQLKQSLFVPQNLGAIVAAMEAAAWLNQTLYHYLGEKNVADTLAQSVPDNITSEMGLALLDVADVIRPFPEVIACLQQAPADADLASLLQVQGGPESLAALNDFLDTYGMRCAGEIDLTQPRWRENPMTLVPLILSHLKNFEPGASRQKFAQGQQEAAHKEQSLLARLRQLPDGETMAQETQRVISLLRNLSGYREYPKYAIVSRYFEYKQALLKEARQLVEAGVLSEQEDIYYLSFEELREVVRTRQLDLQVIRQRKADYLVYARLTPPRVMTSDGENVAGKYHREQLPADALVGLAVSSGVIEGRARVLFSMQEAELEAEDILVTPFTDPSWTPLFVTVKALVTEVGGMYTHGAVIAREYGLPAVVGVEQATRRIQDGQRIRVNGTEGYVEILA